MSHRPVGAGASFNFTSGAATTSSAFSVQSSVLRVVAVGGAAHVKIDGDPSATVTDYYVPSGATATLALTKASNRVTGITTGTTTIISFAEGTHCPFGESEYVSLSASGQSYYNFTHQKVLSVDVTSGVNGYHQARAVIDYNSSGIVTAFSSPDAILTSSQKVSAKGVGSGTLYIQQVQISGDA